MFQCDSVGSLLRQKFVPSVLTPEALGVEVSPELLENLATGLALEPRERKPDLELMAGWAQPLPSAFLQTV